MVFVFHAGFLIQYQLGAAGVSFFFVLSGFILAYNYHSKLINLDRSKIKGFYKARFAKIYPVHVLTFLVSAPLVILYFNPDGLYLVKLTIMSAINLLLVQSFFQSEGIYFNFNGVSWTLSVEAFFYLTFPFLLWVFNKIKVEKRVVGSLTTLLVIWGILFSLNMNLDENNKIFVWALHIFPVARLFEFATGTILGLIFVKRAQNISFVKTGIYTGLELLALIIFFSSMVWSTQFDIGAVLGGFFIPVWSLLIFIFAHQGGIFSKVLSNKFLVFLGEISFSFYMVHQLVLRYFSYLKLDKDLNFGVCLVIALIFSAVMYQFYEEPIRKRIRFGSKQKEKLQAKASA
jgi:peptidoglycan/LPS O-acetylase OafA/YrhL